MTTIWENDGKFRRHVLDELWEVRRARDAGRVAAVDARRNPCPVQSGQEIVLKPASAALRTTVTYNYERTR